MIYLCFRIRKYAGQWNFVFLMCEGCQGNQVGVDQFTLNPPLQYEAATITTAIISK